VFFIINLESLPNAEYKNMCNRDVPKKHDYSYLFDNAILLKLKGLVGPFLGEAGRIYD